MGASKTIFICPQCAFSFQIDDFSHVIFCPFCRILLNIEMIKEEEEREYKEKELEIEKEEKEKKKKEKKKKEKKKKEKEKEKRKKEKNLAFQV